MSSADLGWVFQTCWEESQEEVLSGGSMEHQNWVWMKQRHCFEDRLTRTQSNNCDLLRENVCVVRCVRQLSDKAELK